MKISRKSSIIFLIFLGIQCIKAEHLLINSIHLNGQLPFSEKQILKEIHLEKTANINSITQIQKKVLIFLNRKGYLEAKIDSLTIHESHKKKHENELTIWIDSGPLFKVGRLKIVSDSIKVEPYLKVIESKPGKPFEQDILKNDLQEILKLAAENGYPFAKAEITFVKTVKNKDGAFVNIGIKINPGKKVFIKNIIFEGVHYTHPKILIRELYFKPDMPFRRSWFTKIVRRLQKTQLLNRVGNPQLVRVGTDSILIIVPVEEANISSFDGVVGYVPPPTNQTKEKGYLTGLIHLSFGNLFGTGRKLKVFWEKTDRLSENFNLMYFEPWVMNLPVDGGISFSREVRDTLYIAYDLKLNSQFKFSENFTLFINFNRHTVHPDSLAAYRQKLLKTKSYGIEAGLNYDTRDYPLNPKKGLFYQSSYRFALKENLGPKSILQQDSLKRNVGLNSLTMRFEWYHELFNNQVVATKLNMQNIRGSQLQMSDYFWFGGSQSVRGYRERQFNGFLIGWLNLEYRFIVGRKSRFFLFSDWGYFKTKIEGKFKNQLIRGVGLGLRFSTPMGLMGVDYGLAKGESFRQGKIHVRLSSQL